MEKGRRHILQEVVLPCEGEDASCHALYLRGGCPDNPETSFYSYFNIFSLAKWKKYASLRSFGLRLEGKGKARLRILLRTPADTVHQLAAAEISLDGGWNSAPIAAGGLDGIVYFTLAFHDDARLEYGCFWTPDTPRREVQLRIVVTTFKREQHVRGLVNIFRTGGFGKIYGSPSSARLLIVDNGKTLSPDDVGPDGDIRLIPNPNVGGAGGFSRGMLEVLDDTEATHILLMDDDIEVLAESILRAANFLRFAVSPKLCVGGDMLVLDKRGELHEQGGIIAGGSLDSVKNGLDLLAPENLRYACEESDSDYNAWFFFMFPSKACREIGLALPIFFHGDDVDYSLRLAARGYGPIVHLNGVSVWHAIFYTKRNASVAYYDVRNIHLNVVTGYRYRTGGLAAALAAIPFLFKRLQRTLFLHNYDFADAIIEGCGDFRKGPDFLLRIDAEEHHRKILALVTGKVVPLPPEIFDAERCEKDFARKTGFIEYLLSVMTLHGLLVPRFLRHAHRDGVIDDGVLYQPLPFSGAVSRSKAFRKQVIVYVDRESRMGYSTEIDSWRGIRLWARGVWRLFLLSFELGRLMREYDEKASELTSPETWRRLLKIGKSSEENPTSRRCPGDSARGWGNS